MKYSNMDGKSGSKPHTPKPTGGYEGIGKVSSQQPTNQGMQAVSSGPKSVPTKPGNPRTGMGVKSGKKDSRQLKNNASPSDYSSGRSRTRRGTNRTGAGAQGMTG